MNFIDLITDSGRTPIFIDLNNLLFRYYYVFNPSKFKTKQGLPNGHLFGLCQTLKTLDRLGYLIFICEDSNSSFRQKLNENYKANRDGNISFYRDFQKIRDLISDLPNAYTLISEGFEADDVMYSAAKICSNHNIQCLIFTMDKDLLQALDKNISIARKISLSNSELICYNSAEYNDIFPISPEKLPIYRAFKGDKSDNLPIPVERLPKDLLLDLVDYLYEHNNLIGYNIKKNSHKKWIAKLVENWNVFLSNYKIMKLNPIEFTVLDKSILGSYNKVCDIYDLNQYRDYIKNLKGVL